MKRIFPLLLAIVLMACAQKKTDEQSVPSAWNPDFTGYCGYVTLAELEEALGTPVVGTPEEITNNYRGGFGCSFVGENDSRGENFGYIIFPSAEAFDNLHVDAPYAGVGEEAYLLNSADAQQLWVREEDRYVMVALGSVPRPEKCAKLARLILERMKIKPVHYESP